MTIILDGTTGITTPAINSSGDLELPGGTANGVLYLNGSKVATSGSALTYDGTTFKADAAAVFNDSGADVDFRVEGDTDANLLFVDASADFVGIGTSTPATKLDVSGRAQFVNNGFNYVLVDSTVSDSYFRLASAGTVKWYLRNNTANTNALEITPDAGSTTGLFLTQSGNLGIGMSSPDMALDVRTAPAVDWQIRIGANNTDLDTYDIGRDVSDGLLYFYGNQSGYNGYVFSGIDGERLRIDSSGNLGLGVTPSAWNTVTAIQAKSAHFGGYSHFAYLGANCFYESGWKYIGNAYANRIEMLSGQFQFYTAPSGTAGAAISFTQAMTLDASGNLLVGTTSTTPNPGVAIFPTGGMGQGNSAGGSGFEFNSFRRSAVQIGSITQNGTTAVAYNTSSDRRLKENITAAPEAGAKIDAIEIVSHDWKSAPDEHVEFGVVAQDLYAVAPQAVSVGDDGEEVEKTWGVDYSKLVPMLVKEIQSLRARLAAANL